MGMLCLCFWRPVRLNSCAGGLPVDLFSFSTAVAHACACLALLLLPCVQVMWNTKLLTKGKRVNREFAFISYKSPDEAGNAIRAMHGRYIEGLTKDRDGLTVQFEAQGVGKGSAQGQLPPQQQQGAFVPPVATQQHFLLHQLQQQQQQQGAMQTLMQPQLSDQAGFLQAGDLQQAPQQQQQQLGAGSSGLFSSPTASSEGQQKPGGSPS